jgi:hypothetical protein
MPCPLDPSHTVYRAKLQQHLSKCRSLICGDDTLRQQPFYCKDCNTGRDVSSAKSSSSVDVDVLLGKVTKLYDTFAHEIKPLADLSHIVVPEEG